MATELTLRDLLIKSLCERHGWEQESEDAQTAATDVDWFLSQVNSYATEQHWSLLTCCPYESVMNCPKECPGEWNLTNDCCKSAKFLDRFK
jgi:hypothetical protein